MFKENEVMISPVGQWILYNWGLQETHVDLQESLCPSRDYPRSRVRLVLPIGIPALTNSKCISVLTIVWIVLIQCYGY